MGDHTHGQAEYDVLTLITYKGTINITINRGGKTITKDTILGTN